MIRKVSSSFMLVAFKGGDSSTQPPKSPTRPPKSAQVVFLPFQQGVDSHALRDFGKPSVVASGMRARVLAAAQQVAGLHLHPEMGGRFMDVFAKMA